MTPIEIQTAKLRAAVDAFQAQFGRAPRAAFDADGVIYPFEETYLAHHNKENPDLPVTGPFTKFDVGYGLDEKTAEALQESMRTLDWSTLTPHPAALALIPVIIDAGVDVSVATSHRTDNVYQPSAKVYQFKRDFKGQLDDRVIITQDKTRVLADWLFDDKPEITGKLERVWQQVIWDQLYNRDVHGPRATWETVLIVLTDLIDQAVAAAKQTTFKIAAVATDLPAVLDLGQEAAEPVTTSAGDADDAPAAITMPWGDSPATPAAEHVNTADTATALPWATPEKSAEPTGLTSVVWDDLVTGDAS